MSVPSEMQLSAQVPAAVAEALGLATSDVKVRRGGAPPADLLLEAATHTFVVNVLRAASPGPIVAHAERASSAAKRLRRRVTPLLVVPYMTKPGRDAAERAEISWLDLSGNAQIVAPGLRVIVNGNPSRFRGPGRPSSVFAPKSARVVRWLLMHPDDALSQREIARETSISEGFVSRIVSRLLDEGYVTRVGGDSGGDEDGSRRGRRTASTGHALHAGVRPAKRLRVKDRALLLDAWHAEYRFDKHVLVRGTVAARSGDALTRAVSDSLTAARIEHAATGLSAAWQFQHFASFRIATFFVNEAPTERLRAKLGFREEGRGANLWFVLPNDVGVFQGAETRDGVRCVHPVQAYMDLKGHPERAVEAAEHLRAELLSKRRDG